MSAQDNLSENQFRLFHGTNAELKPGDWLDPQKSKAVHEEDSEYWPVAHATDDIGHASTHGAHVYEVHHSVEQEQWDPGHYVSEEGFEVKRKINPKVVKRITK